jgi:hypothetical protein
MEKVVRIEEERFDDDGLTEVKGTKLELVTPKKGQHF